MEHYIEQLGKTNDSKKIPMTEEDIALAKTILYTKIDGQDVLTIFTNNKRTGSKETTATTDPLYNVAEGMSHQKRGAKDFSADAKKFKTQNLKGIEYGQSISTEFAGKFERNAGENVSAEVLLRRLKLPKTVRNF